jgi:hypothetical protein
MEGMVRGPPFSTVNTYVFRMMGSAIRVGRSAVKVPSSRASSVGSRVVIVCTDSKSRRRARSPSHASLTASRARRVVSFSASGRGREESRSHTARVSPTTGGMKGSMVGGEGGRDGGSFKVNLVDGGVVGGVLPAGRPFFPIRFGEDGGVN